MQFLNYKKWQLISSLNQKIKINSVKKILSNYYFVFSLNIMLFEYLKALKVLLMQAPDRTFITKLTYKSSNSYRN